MRGVKVDVTGRVDPALVPVLDRLARERRWSRAALVAVAVERYVAEHADVADFASAEVR